MWRRPQEQDDGENDRSGREIGGDRGGAREHGEAAGQSADDDVQHAALLEPQGIDDAIDERPEEDVERDMGVQDPGRGADGQGDDQPDTGQPRPAGAKHAGGERPVARPRHPRIQFAFGILIERPGTGRRQKNRQDENGNFPQRQGRARRRRHAGDRAQRNRRTDPQFEYV